MRPLPRDLCLGLSHLWPQQELSPEELREPADTVWNPRDVGDHVGTEIQKHCSRTDYGVWETQLNVIFVLPLHSGQRNLTLSQWIEGGRNFQTGVSCTTKSLEEVWQEPQLAVPSAFPTSGL